MKSDENSTPIPQQTVQGNLPSPYADDTVVQAFAGAVDGMLAPVDPVLASMADNYQAFNAPAELLPYLVQVSGARVEPGWPERAVRAAIDLAGWLATHRGTPAGLLTEARIVYGWLLEIDDPGDVHLPGDSTQWPDHTPLYVTMEPRTTGKAPISYDQSTLERLVEAHIPASLTYQIVPSTDHIALYDDPYCTGRAWLVYSDTPDLQVLNADNRASSAWNRTSSVIALYKDTNFLGTNEFIQPNSKADQLNLDNQASSLRFLTNVPADAWGLYDQRGGANGSGQLIGVYHGTRTNLLNTAGGKAVSLVNNTSHTLQLFNADRSTFQMVYPGLTADLLDINLVHALDSVVDHATVPNGAYCLYEEVQQGGKSWLFWDDSDQPIDLTDPQIAAHPVCSVYNNTTRTLQLLNHTGDDQLFYPQAYNSVSTALNQTTTTATLYDGPPDRCFCLYEGPAQTGRQWVFKDTEALTHLDNPTINAANAISSVDNKTIYTLELFQNNDGTGTSQLIYPQNQVDITTPGLDNTANSVNLYHTPPPNYFALYSDFNQSGMQWVFKDTEALTHLDNPTINAANAISSVDNKTIYTLELFQNNDGTGTSQLIYPQNQVDITTLGLDNTANSVNLYHTPPPNYFALYSDFNQSGMQWVFKDTEGLTRLDDPVTNAAGAISSASNQTQYTIELFQNNNGTGASQLVYPTITTDITTTGLEDHITSVNLYHGPPANYFCLYQGSWSGTQWVFKDTAGLTNLTDLQYGGASSAITFNNRTQYTLELFQNTDGTGTSQLAYPIAKNLMATPGLQGNLKSVNVYHGPPNNYFALYENQFNTGRQWVLKDTAGLINLAGSQYGDASSVISSASNQTIYTLELFQNTDGTGTSQLVYPNTTVNTDAIADRITSVNVYHGPPTNYFCLYQEWYEYGRQWVFKDTAGLTNFTNTAVFGDLSHVISCVKNQTQYTLEIFRNSNGTGTSQLIYPTTTINVASALNEVVTSVNVYHGPPNNYFCLYEANAQGMRQWAFKDTAGLTDLTNTGIFNNASSVISSVNNLTLYTLELFQNANGSGTSQLVYPNTTPNVTTSGLNDTVKSVNLYHGPPNNYFCLYQDNVSDSSRQWVFRSNPGHIDLTNTAVYGTAASVLSAALNKSPNPIELFDQASQNGNIQLVPPSSQVDGFINNLNDKIKSFTVYQPSGFPTPCMLVAKHSGKCIDVQQFSTTPNTTVWQYQVNNTANQQWIIVNSGGGVYRIYSVNSLLCLGPQNGAGGSSVPIAQLTPTTAGYLYWHVVDQGGGYYRLWNYDNGYSIDVSGSSTANQAAIIQYGNTGGDNQRFSMRATTAAAKNTGAAQNGTDPNSDREDNSKENTELGGSLPRGYRAES